MQTLCLPTEEPDPDKFSYQLATNDQRQEFIDSLETVTDLEVMRKLQATAKRMNAVDEWVAAGKRLAEAAE